MGLRFARGYLDDAMSWFELPKTLRQRLTENATIADEVESRIHYQELPAESTYPHIWFARSSRDRDRLQDGQEASTTERFSLEIVSNSDCEAIVDAVVESLESFEGQYGTRLVQLVEVEDADDDYQFQSIGDDLPDYVHALQIAVYAVPLN
ncbi:MAG: hypothetical protein Aurels2KO_10350 [Aureliella sp.]